MYGFTYIFPMMLLFFCLKKDKRVQQYVHSLIVLNYVSIDYT